MGHSCSLSVRPVLGVANSSPADTFCHATYICGTRPKPSPHEPHMPSKKPSPPDQPAGARQSDFSIDEFIGEIEKAEDERLNKRLPQERLRNKRALDNAARRAAEADGSRQAAADNLVQKAEGPLPQEKPKKGKVRPLRRHRHAASRRPSRRPTPSTARELRRLRASPRRPASATCRQRAQRAQATRHRPRHLAAPPPRTPTVMEQLRGALATAPHRQPARPRPARPQAGRPASAHRRADRRHLRHREGPRGHHPARPQGGRGQHRVEAAPPGARAKSPKAASRSSWSRPTSPPATSRPPSPSSSRASTTARPTRSCSASPARARPSPWRRSSRARSARRSSSPPTRRSPPSSMASSRRFFPDNAVEYFVSYYDYYQPEAYVPRTDTYIEKESTINEQIDRMRHSATRALLERDDVIIVASVSCIYGIGSVEDYTAMTFDLRKGQKIDQRELLRALDASCSTSAATPASSAAPSASAATPSSSSPPTTRTPPGASRCSATRSSRSPSSIRSPARRAADLTLHPRLRQLATT